MSYTPPPVIILDDHTMMTMTILLTVFTSDDLCGALARSLHSLSESDYFRRLKGMSRRPVLLCLTLTTLLAL
jgi:hypothetical protein